jgi:hypothetical protein
MVAARCAAASLKKHPEEVGSIVDEIDQGTRPKRVRVLRATDVMPPFDSAPAPADAGGTEPEPPEPATPQSVQADADDRSDNPGGEAPADTDRTEGDVPQYDLAENILAEQRRVASRRRRAPSQPHEEPQVLHEPKAAEPSAIELPCEDLPELQRVVAEIVARDIERLCRRPIAN